MKHWYTHNFQWGLISILIDVVDVVVDVLTLGG